VKQENIFAKAGDNVKKILFPLLLVALIPSAALAYTDEYGIWRLDPPAIEQFNGITINGKTAEQTMKSARLALVDKLDAEISNAIDISNEAVNRFNALLAQDKAMRHITEQSPAYTLSDPYDFIDLGSCVVHWLTENGKTLTCEHYSKSEMQKHAQIFNECNAAWEDLNTKRNKANNMNTAEYVNPFIRDAVFKALKPFYEQKAANMASEIAQRNSRIKSITCKNYDIEVLSPGIMGFCRQKNICRLAAIKNKNDILEISCACGHPLEQHEIKYKK
jgi:hypothetical protein